ncbi:MAG: YggU family protein [Methanomicrobiaceae archaeon]|nr:YggU family protein [Methanomicrobiaceae archaeon]
MDINEAITAYQEGIIISLDVSAGSKKTVFPSGYNKWRKAFLCRISAPPVEGRANKEITLAVSEFFSVSSSEVIILSGKTSSLKRILIKGVVFKDAEALLGKFI